MNRRRLLAIAAALLYGAAVPSGIGARREVSIERLARLIANLFEDAESARAIGQRYLAQNPAEANRSRLLEALFDSLAPRRDCLPWDLGSGLARRIRSDFSEDATSIVDGWLLSRTEARLCALIALS